MDLRAITVEALRLDPDERARLAAALLESLEALSAIEIERLWAEEAVRRLAGYRAGKVAAHPAGTVHEEILQHLQ